MSFKLIPPEERHKHHCCVCGETRSVKYLIQTTEYGETKELPYCNRCALLHSALVEKNKEESTMSTEVTKEEWEETNRRVREWFHEIEVNTIKKMPLWMRLNFYGNKIGKAISEGHEDKDVKWDYINEMLTKDLNIFDYNMFEPVHSWEEFCNLRFDVIAASEGIGPWHKHKCKDCGKEFYMNYKEVHFYEEKGLSLPKRCKECREKRKNNPAK